MVEKVLFSCKVFEKEILMDLQIYEFENHILAVGSVSVCY